MERWARRVRDGGSGDGGGGGPDGGGVPGGPAGPVLRVETMTGSGMHKVVTISPAAGQDEAQFAAVRSVVRALLDLAGHQEGPVCTEVELTARGPRILACRLGGAAAGPAG